MSSDYPVDCPICGAQLLFDCRPQRGLCTVCGNEFELPPEDPSLSIGLEDPTDEGDGDDAELDGLRIRQIAQLKRSLHRARSYMVVVLAGCLVAILQSVLLIARQIFGASGDLRVAAYAAVIAVAGIGVVWSLRKFRAIGHELAGLQEQAPTGVPDFSTLSDGSQRARNLENLRD